MFNPHHFRRIDSALAKTVRYVLRDPTIELPTKTGRWVTLPSGSWLEAVGFEETPELVQLIVHNTEDSPTGDKALDFDNCYLRQELEAYDRQALRTAAFIFVREHESGTLANLVHEFLCTYTYRYEEYLTGKHADFGDELIRAALKEWRLEGKVH